MKVCLAAQTLSSSVAVAFETLHDLGLSKFQGCLATADFIKRIDRLFDILNSRSVSAMGYKQPIRNLNYMLPFLKDTKHHLLSLTDTAITPLYQTKRKTFRIEPIKDRILHDEVYCGNTQSSLQLINNSLLQP